MNRRIVQHFIVVLLLLDLLVLLHEVIATGCCGHHAGSRRRCRHPAKHDVITYCKDIQTIQQSATKWKTEGKEANNKIKCSFFVGGG